MTWIQIEGLDKVSKSTVAEKYRKQGFQLIHFSAPDKKYSQPGYTGPDYLSDIVQLFVTLSGKDVVFDRTPHYGELVWPNIYRRKQLISSEDIDVIREIEDQNNTQRILMHDPDMKSHWERCVKHKEPLDPSQFQSARDAFYKMALDYGFELKTHHDYFSDNTSLEKEPLKKETVETIQDAEIQPTVSILETSDKVRKSMTPEQKRLSEANAINDILSKQIIKLKGAHYESIEEKIRVFLNNELAKILGSDISNKKDNQLTLEEVQIIRSLISRSTK